MQMVEDVRVVAEGKKGRESRLTRLQTDSELQLWAKVEKFNHLLLPNLRVATA